MKRTTPGGLLKRTEEEREEGGKGNEEKKTLLFSVPHRGLAKKKKKRKNRNEQRSYDIYIFISIYMFTWRYLAMGDRNQGSHHGRKRRGQSQHQPASAPPVHHSEDLNSASSPVASRRLISSHERAIRPVSPCKSSLCHSGEEALPGRRAKLQTKDASHWVGPRGPWTGNWLALENPGPLAWGDGVMGPVAAVPRIRTRWLRAW